MCRNIKPLFNFEPPATDEEVAAGRVDDDGAGEQVARRLLGANAALLLVMGVAFLAFQAVFGRGLGTLLYAECL